MKTALDDVRSDLSLFDWISKARLARRIWPQTAVLQTCYSRNICLGQFTNIMVQNSLFQNDVRDVLQNCKFCLRSVLKTICWARFEVTQAKIHSLQIYYFASFKWMLVNKIWVNWQAISLERTNWFKNGHDGWNNLRVAFKAKFGPPIELKVMIFYCLPNKTMQFTWKIKTDFL